MNNLAYSFTRRCNTAIRKLEEIVQNNALEINNLKRTINTLENKLHQSEDARNLDNEMHKKSTNQMKFTLNDARNEVEHLQQKYEEKITETKRQLELRFEQLQIQKDDYHQNEIIEMRKKIKSDKIQVFS